MISSPQDLANAALSLLHLTRRSGLTAPEIAALELGAATLANHVADWQAKAMGDKKEPADIGFGADYPIWNTLRKISNGLKHAKPFFKATGAIEQRFAEWEDDDFWDASHNIKTLFIIIDGEQKSLSSITAQFVNEFLAAPAVINPEWPQNILGQKSECPSE